MVVECLTPTSGAPRYPTESRGEPVRLAVDALASVWPDSLLHARLGALLHGASVNSTLEHTLDVLRRHDGNLFQLRTLFGPQHGFVGHTQDNMVEWESYRHPDLDIPVHSLYGAHRKPTPEMLEDIDVLLIDLQDVGARYYTFIWTMFLCLEACAEAGKTVVVVDRPNPINGQQIEGPLLNPSYTSFVGLHPLPARHGCTIGELACQFAEEVPLDVELIILPMSGWSRDQWFDETGLPWVMPSPNMPTLDTAIVYPGMCLLEGTNLSEGRGTTRPFELFGAPWLDAAGLCRDLKGRLPGALLRETQFQPTFQKHAGQLCHGAQIHVQNRNLFRPWQTAVDILRWVRRHSDNFAFNPPPYEYEENKPPIDILLGRPHEEVL